MFDDSHIAVTISRSPRETSYYIVTTTQYEPVTLTERIVREHRRSPIYVHGGDRWGWLTLPLSVLNNWHPFKGSVT